MLNYSDVYSELILQINYGTNMEWGAFVRSENNGIVTYKATCSFEMMNGYVNVGNLLIEFKDNKIIRYGTTMNTYDENLLSVDYIQSIMVEFDYENEAISFDTTGFDTTNA